MEEEFKTQVVNESPAQDAGKQQSDAQDAEEEHFDAEYVKKLRAEAAQYRTRLRELEQKVKAHEDEKLSEQEKLQKKLTELEREAAEKARALQERTTEYEVKLKAANLGIIDPEAAWRLLDVAAVEFDDDGKPKNIEPLLKELIKNKPYLAQNTQYATTNPARSGVNQTTFTRSQLRDPKFFAEHRDEIMRAMQEGCVLED